MSLEHILLGMLRSPSSGYELKADFKRSIANFWQAELSQIYPTLKRLETRGLLVSAEAPSRRGPRRRVYRLTDEGRAELRRWLRSGPQIRSERFAYMAQLFFMDELGDLEETEAFMVELRAHLAEWLASLRETERGVLATEGSWEEFDDTGFHRMSTLRMGILSIGAKLAWCDETLQRIRARAARENDDTNDTKDPTQAAAPVGSTDEGRRARAAREA